MIEVTYGGDVNIKIINAKLTMQAFDMNGSVAWTCSGDAVLVDKWLPPACRI
jgi:hypothetical protein